MYTRRYTEVGDEEDNDYRNSDTDSDSDEEEIKEGLILPKSQYTYLYRISNLALFSGVYALHRQYYDLACVPFSVWLTSINYWRKPDYSWRRYLDMAVVHLVLSYQIYLAYSLEHKALYYSLVSLSCVCFPISFYYYKKKRYWESTILHSLVHIFGNISNIFLYYGDCSFPLKSCLLL